DVTAEGVDQRVRIGGQHAPPVRDVGGGDGVVIGFLAMAETVEDEQQHGLGSGHGGNTCREKRGNGSRSMLYARVPCPPRGPASPADAASGPRPMETLRPAGGTPVTVTLPWPRPPAGSGGTVVRTGRTQA